jgi:D-alanyl-D-alanine carboxypeptidase
VGNRRTTAADEIQEQLDTLVAQGVPGVLAYVTDQDGASRFYTAGVADLNTALPLGPETAYRVGSTTKTFTAVVTLQLVAEGRLNLDDCVANWIDAWEFPDPGRLTIEHLLRMRSGLFDFEDDQSLASNFEAHLRTYELDEVLEIALAHEPHFQPGERFNYSNTNYCLLEKIIENVTGRPLGSELSDRVFVPVGMGRTVYPSADDLSLPEPYMRGYHWTEEGWRDCSRVFFGRGDGALVSTALDQARFFRALLHGRLLPAALLKSMMTVVIDDPPAAEPYGMGLLMPSGPRGQLCGHSGSGYGYMNEPYLESERNRFAVCAMNGTFFGFPGHAEVRERFSGQLRTAVYS